MSELMTNAKEEYLDLCQALKDIKPGDHLLDEKTNIVKDYAWRLYLLCEELDKRCDELSAPFAGLGEKLLKKGLAQSRGGDHEADRDG